MTEDERPKAGLKIQTYRAPSPARDGSPPPARRQMRSREELAPLTEQIATRADLMDEASGHDGMRGRG